MLPSPEVYAEQVPVLLEGQGAVIMSRLAARRAPPVWLQQHPDRVRDAARVPHAQRFNGNAELTGDSARVNSATAKLEGSEDRLGRVASSHEHMFASRPDGSWLV